MNTDLNKGVRNLELRKSGKRREYYKVNMIAPQRHGDRREEIR